MSAEPTPFSDAYQRRWERTGMDPDGIMKPQTCNLTGHVPGCPGKAGGDHELEPGWILYCDEDGFEIAVEVVGR